VSNVILKQSKLRHIDRFESDHTTFNLNNSAAHTCALSLVDTDFVSFHVNGLATFHESLLDHFVDCLVLIVYNAIVFINSTVLQTSLEVLQLFQSWLDVWTHFNLLESEALVDKATVHQLVAHRPHVFLGDRMHVCILLRKLSKLLRPQAQLLSDSTE